MERKDSSTQRSEQITQQIVNSLFLHLVKTSLHVVMNKCHAEVQNKSVSP